MPLRRALFFLLVLTACGAQQLGHPTRVRTVTPPNHQAYGLEGVGLSVRNTTAFYAAVATTTTTTTTTTRPAPRPTSATRPPDSPVRATSGERCAYGDLIRSTFGSVGEWAVGIAWRESNCIPDVASPTECLGLFQICWPLHADIEQAACGRSDRGGLFVPECNVATAKRMYDGTGPTPWRL